MNVELLDVMYDAWVLTRAADCVIDDALRSVAEYGDERLLTIYGADEVGAILEAIKALRVMVQAFQDAGMDGYPACGRWSWIPQTPKLPSKDYLFFNLDDLYAWMEAHEHDTPYAINGVQDMSLLDAIIATMIEEAK